MNPSLHVNTQSLPAGLYFVATPIGNARDITLRALDVLASADVIAAEDTRNTRRLLDIHGIALNDRPLLAYHDHNGPKVRPKLLSAIAEGKSVAYASDAGTPLVADPGYGLMMASIEAGCPVTAIPGASAPLAALSLAGLPTDRFLFAGFAPTTQKARQSFLKDLDSAQATLVLFESPRRVESLLADAMAVYGADRRGAICRELTKKFEEVRRGTLSELAQSLQEKPAKGEVVVLFDRAGKVELSEAELDAAIQGLLGEMSVKDIAASLSAELGVPRKRVYARALDLNKAQRDLT